MSITPEQSKVARRLLGWSEEHLADKARISQGIVTRFETGGRHPADEIVFCLRRALESAGIGFTEVSVTLYKGADDAD